MKITCIFCITLILLSCTKISDNDNYKKIDVKISNNISVYDLFSNIDLIPLETSADVLLEYPILKYVITDNYIYVLNQKQLTIFIFDKKGNYINKINRKGNGPGEYLSIIDFNINRFSNNVEILTRYKVLTYDYIGKKFIKEYKLNTSDMPRSFHNVNSEMDILFCENINKKLILYSREDNKEIDSTYIRPDFIYRKTPLGFNISPFFIYNDTLRLYEGANGNIYTILADKEITHSYIKWDFGEENFDYNVLPTEKDIAFYADYCWKRSMQSALCFYSLAENENYIITHFWYKKQTPALIYNKKTKEYVILSNYKENMKCAFDNIDNEHFYLLCPVEHIHQVINKDILNTKNKEILENIEKEDNPILIRYKLKKKI